MKRIGTYFAKIIATALVICLVVVCLPQIKTLVEALFPGVSGSAYTTATLLKREMQKMGKLTAVEYTDTGVLVSTIPAALIGDAQKVSIPYSYQISFGVNLADIMVRADEDGSLTFFVPSVVMINDKLTVTGKAEVYDFWIPLTDERYQQILDEQAATLRESYLSNADIQAQAWDATVEQLRTLFSKWISSETVGVSPDMRFIAYDEGEYVQSAAEPTVVISEN